MVDERDKEIETITFYIERGLKKLFQIKLIQDNLTMTEKLIESIREYVEKK